MMGWLTPHRAGEAGVRHYRAYQCGLCHHLGAEHGLVTRLAAGPDLVAWQVFLDVVGDAEAPLGARPCVLRPRGRALPARAPTQNTALAAAFGLWMGVEKARDDWRDEGRLLGWLAARVLAGPGARARATLVEAGFPVAEIQAWLEQQAALERLPRVPLEEASAPTRAIGRLVFGFAARHRPALAPQAEAVGEALAAWLFWVDGLLDWPRDVAGRRYNPLARSLDGPPPPLPPEALRQQALAEADLALERLRAALEPLAPRGLGGAYLRAVLLDGPRDRLARLRALVPHRRRTARDLLPPAPTASARLRRVARLAVGRARRSPPLYRLQAGLALTLAWAFPNRAWAQRWWPEAPLDPATPALPASAADGGAGDTGWGDTGWGDTGGVDTATPRTGPNDANWGDACANNWGYCDPGGCCDALCIQPCCAEPMGDACDTSGACQVDCSGVDCA